MRRLHLVAVLLALAAAGCGNRSGSAPVAPAASVAAAPAAQQLAADFTLKDVAGNVVHLSDTKGKVRLVDFWTTWFAPCREEIPMFKELQAAYGPKGFTMVGIAMDDEGADVVKPFVQENGISYPTLLGDSAVKESYGPLVGFPTKVLVDRDGKIVERFVGPVPKAVLEKKIEALL